MPSFDIVSKTDVHEVDNAVAGVMREIAQRFDFKGSRSSVTREEDSLILLADDELKLRQVQELLRGHLARRQIDAHAVSFDKIEKAAGQSVRHTATIQQGIDRDLAKTLVKEIKAAKLKVQVLVQGDEVRVSGKKRDDLQAAIALVKGLGIEQPLQFVNFRE